MSKFLNHKKTSISLFIVALAVVTHLIVYQISNPYKKLLLTEYYRLTDQSLEVQDQGTLDEIIAVFPKVKFVSLDLDYIDKTESGKAPFRNMLKKSEYYIITRADLFKNIVGEHKIIEFLPNDHYLENCILHGDSIYWLMDEEVLSKFLLLEQELTRLSYNPKAISINDGYRYPEYNKRIGGASQSRHIVGEAIDLKIGDIDQNGQADSLDKQIVLDLVDQKIIGNTGGVGLYPGTQVVHMDTRGFRARWNSY